MAKQSGIHLIKGKVGEHSYYKQTGVASGLIRSINQGMSSRVKTAEEYANTRLNNVEFGGAANVAGLLGKMVVPKFRPMILPFSQSKMAKSLLDLARLSSLEWGKRSLQATDTPEIAAVLASQSKRDFANTASVTLSRTSASVLSAQVQISTDQINYLIGLGADAISIEITTIDLATGKFNNVTNKIQNGYIRIRNKSSIINGETLNPSEAFDETETFSVNAFNPTPELYNGHQLVIVVALPQKIVGGSYYVLQELCSFTALEMPAYAG